MRITRAKETTAEEALELIAAEERIYIRAAAVPSSGSSWKPRLLELVAGAPPPTWSPAIWVYPRAVLASEVRTGEEVASWLREHLALVADRPLALPPLSAQLRWQRLQSHTPSSYQTLDWPVVECTLANLDTELEPQEPLISSGDAPSFSSLYVAAACFFGFRQQSTESLHQGIALRQQDTRGRILRVRVSGDEVTVDIAGDALAEMSVELAGGVPGPRQDVAVGPDGDASVVRLPLTTGLPSGAWVLLRSGVEWIDKRILTGPWARQNDPEVEFVEPGTRLEVLLANREGSQVEFKREIPAVGSSPKAVMKTVCAFANGQGGSLLFGIDDDHRVVGVVPEEVDVAKDRLAELVRAWVHPAPGIGFDVLPVAIRDRVVLEMHVDPDLDLHDCGTTHEAHQVYIRHAAVSVPATSHEIAAIARARTAATVSRWPYG